MNVIVLFKDSGQKYWFRWDYDPRSYGRFIKTLETMAQDPEFDLTWHDAAKLIGQVRKTLEKKYGLDECCGR